MTILEPRTIDQVRRSPISIAIGPWNTGPAQEVTEFTGGQMTFTLNDGHQLAFSMPGRSEAAVLSSGLATDVWLTVDTALTGRFRMLPLVQQWGSDGQDDIAVTAVSYKRLLAWRYLHTALTYEQVDQGTIVWALIAHTQGLPGGDLGITKGASVTGKPRDRTYFVGDNVGELGNNMSNVENGCWWDIDAAGVFTAHQYGAFPTQPTPLALGSNALTLTRTPSTAFANGVMASGSQEQTTPHWEDATNIATDPRGRWEVVTSSPDTIVQNTLVEQAKGLLNRSSRPPAVWTADIAPRRWRGDSAYHPGDFITVVIPPDTRDPLGTPSGVVTAQVTEVSASFDGDGALAIAISAIEGSAAP